MAVDRSAFVTAHAELRLAQRNLRDGDIQYVLQHGTRIRNGSAIFVHLGKRDIPDDDMRVNSLRRLEGTVLVLDPENGYYLTTAYRNRRTGIKDIKRKRKYRMQTGFDC